MRLNWGEERVYFMDGEGQMQSILANCTDAGGVDPFVELGGGRALFRYEDLLRLAALAEALRRDEEERPGRVKRLTPHT